MKPALSVGGPLASLLGALLLLAGATAGADEFLGPEEAFRYSASATGDRVDVTWKVAPGYYLYRKRLGFESATARAVLGEAEYPSGIAHTDEYFGEQEIYRDSVTIRVPVTFPGTRPDSLALKLRFQGCADAGLCYPPTTWETSVELPRASTGNVLSNFLQGGPVERNDEFLPVEQAFMVSGEVRGPNTVRLRWLIADGYYLYRHKMKVASSSQLVQLGAPDLPPGKSKTDEFFGAQEVYYQQVIADVPFSRASPDAAAFDADVTFQGCADAGLCYPPTTRKLSFLLPAVDAASFDGGAPGGVISEQDRLARLIQTGNLMLVLATFFGLGLLLSLTPCVLPMVPILSGIIAGQGSGVTTRRAFLLSLAYVLGMAVTYTAAGAVFAAAGQQAQAFFQQTWIIVLFAALFVALALAMFGLYELQVPSAIQTRLVGLSSRQRAGTYFGTAVMGALSALVVTTCVAPPLVATFVVLGQAGDVVRGALALFALSLGMGAPLLLVGASAGKLLPKAGAWMDTVKRFFGVLFLGVAIWMVERILPGPLVLALWGALLFVAVFALGAFDRARTGRTAVAARVAGALACIWGALLIVGAAAGGSDPLQPLKGLRADGAAAAEGLPFKPVRSVEDLDREISAASAAGQAAMLDFSAEWCVSCKEMERYTFPDEGVKAALEGVVLLRADVTENNASDQALLKRFGIFGPPTIAFFGPDGVERRNFRLVGYVKAERFRDHVLRAVAPQSPAATASRSADAAAP